MEVIEGDIVGWCRKDDVLRSFVNRWLWVDVQRPNNANDDIVCYRDDRMKIVIIKGTFCCVEIGSFTFVFTTGIGCGG